MMSSNFGRHFRIQAHRRNRCAVKIASNITAEVSPRKGSVPGRHLVEHRAKRKQVGAGIQFFAARLLRRHISDRAERSTRAGQVLLINAASACSADRLARTTSQAVSPSPDQNRESWRARAW